MSMRIFLGTSNIFVLSLGVLNQSGEELRVGIQQGRSMFTFSARWDGEC